jgi:hypothetical protein
MAHGGTGTRLAALALLPVLAGCAAATGAGEGSPAADRSASPDPVDSFRSSRTYDAVAAPVRLRIPDARVDTGLQRLGLAAGGAIAVPSRPDVAGWYAQGPRPGQPGPAVILGHVDSETGPGVFYSVSRLRAGAVIHVDRADGSTARFRVTGVSRVPKSRFPTDVVYSPTLEASLRLVTCGGTVEPATGHYRDNVIVFAVPA